MRPHANRPRTALLLLATLVAVPSSQSFGLPHSQIHIRCASMASFQPNAQLYDGNGIQPDVKVIRTPEYYLGVGEDVVLEKALSILKEEK